MISKILFVDDDQINTALCKRLLLRVKDGLEIQIENDACSALNHISTKYAPDLIFLDMNMPGMGGIEFMQEFKKLNLKGRIIILTSIELQEKTLKVIKELGCADVVIKPLTEEKILEYFK